MDQDGLKDSKLVASISVAFFVAFTIGIYAPVSIYCANVNEYWYTLRMIWYVPAIVFVVTLGISFCFMYFLQGLLHDVATGLMFAVGLCFYLQGNFLHITVGIFDGSHIDWSVYRGQMIVNALIWCFIVLSVTTLCAVKPLLLGKISGYASLVLSVMQIISLVFLLTPVIAKQGMSVSMEPVFSSEGLYDIGDDNIIVLIVDVWDEQYMDYVLHEMKDVNEIFDGFEFYDNFTSEYNCTNYSFASSLVTGEHYHNEKDLGEWVEDKSVKRLYFDELTDKGYDVSIYTEAMRCFPERVRKMTTNYREIPKRFYNMRTCFAILYRTAGCVYFPDVVKPYIWLDDVEIANTATTDGSIIPYNDANGYFKEELDKNGITVREKTKEYKMIHLRGVHEPFYVDDWGNAAPEHWDWKVTAKGCTRILEDYFNWLKDAGVYDDSVIIVTGDHGYHHTYGVLSNPAFLIKYKDSHGAVKINSNEAGLVNFAATIADLAGVEDTTPYGVSVSDIDENTKFARYYYGNTFNREGNISTDNLLEYITPEDTNDVKMFKVTGVEYAKDGHKIEHGKNCMTCIDHIRPEIMDEFHVVDKHCNIN